MTQEQTTTNVASMTDTDFEISPLPEAITLGSHHA